MMRASFYLNRLLRREAPLAALSVSQADLLAELAGKRVALVGNARALGTQSHGAEIDAQDIVVRINRAPMPDAKSHGTRTDWLALAVRLGATDRARIAPKRVLWMSHKRKRLDWKTASSDGFYLHPLSDYTQLKTQLGAQPSTGAMVIDLLVASDLMQLTLFGFDFMASLSLSGSRNAAKTPHDFNAEAARVAQLQANDPRVVIR